jgi:hypothetical protein
MSKAKKPLNGDHLASVLTKRSGLDSLCEFQRVGSVTEQHGSVRSCKSGFDSRPALQTNHLCLET